MQAFLKIPLLLVGIAAILLNTVLFPLNRPEFIQWLVIFDFAVPLIMLLLLAIFPKNEKLYVALVLSFCCVGLIPFIRISEILVNPFAPLKIAVPLGSVVALLCLKFAPGIRTLKNIFAVFATVALFSYSWLLQVNIGFDFGAPNQAAGQIIEKQRLYRNLPAKVLVNFGTADDRHSLWLYVTRPIDLLLRKEGWLNVDIKKGLLGWQWIAKVTPLKGSGNAPPILEPYSDEEIQSNLEAVDARIPPTPWVFWLIFVPFVPLLWFLFFVQCGKCDKWYPRWKPACVRCGNVRVTPQSF